MKSQQNVIDCYNKAAENYAAKFGDELYKKHFDCFLLKEFASVNKVKGTMADFGCGPGQTTKFIHECGIKKLIGIDISPEMINVAQNLFPEIKFDVADMLNLPYKPNYFGAAIAFYAIVHFTKNQLKIAFKEIHRVLKKEGQFLLSFHIGDEIIHHNTFLDKQVDIDFYFFQIDYIIQLLQSTGFQIIDILERAPYKGHEYPSKRAYIWVKKTHANTV